MNMPIPSKDQRLYNITAHNVDVGPDTEPERDFNRGKLGWTFRTGL